MVSFNLTRLPSKLEGNRLYYTCFAVLAQEGYPGRRLLRVLWPNTVPQPQAYQFVTGIKAEQLGVHVTAMTNYQAAQHFNLFRFTGRIPFKRDMLGKQFNCLPVIPMFLSF